MLPQINALIRKIREKMHSTYPSRHLAGLLYILYVLYNILDDISRWIALKAESTILSYLPIYGLILCFVLLCYVTLFINPSDKAFRGAVSRFILLS